MTLHVAEARAAAVQALERPVQSLPVWARCVHGVTRAEAAVVASPPFQRLRRLRQMGLAFHAFPGAENTRASHSLGVAYWGHAYMTALRTAPDAGTRAALAAVDRELEGLSLDLVVRLFSLLHDIDLLPLGHTLRYQSGLFAEPDGRPRLAACVAAIKAHAAASGFTDAPTPGERAAWQGAFEQHLDAAAAALADAPGAAAQLVRNLVNSGLGADLVDFALRDSFAIGRPQDFPVGLTEALRLIPDGEAWSLALEGADAAALNRAVAIADDLYRARFEVFATSVFNPVKLAADAMLDFVLRRLGDRARAALPEARILSMGDDELVDALRSTEGGLAAPLMPALVAGALHEEVWRSDDLAAFRHRADAARALSLDPPWRIGAEAALAERLPWAAPGDVIVAVSPPTSQAKPADARLHGPDGMFTLAEAAGLGHRSDAAAIQASYAGLWSVRVYLAPGQRAKATEVAGSAAALFGGGG